MIKTIKIDYTKESLDIYFEDNKYTLNELKEIGLFAGGDKEGKIKTLLEFTFFSKNNLEKNKKTLEDFEKMISAEGEFEAPKDEELLSPSDIEEGKGEEWGYSLNINSKYKILH